MITPDRIYSSNPDTNYTINVPEKSEWACYLFGNKPGGCGFIYTPRKGQVPNWFVRWMMKVCFDCTWVKERGK
jgi:hypothetical protein